MKKFENPTLDIQKYDVEDIITVSGDGEVIPDPTGNGALPVLPNP